MKKWICLFVLSVVSFAFSAEWASDYNSMIAFQKDQNRSGYVKPIATYMGTVLNGSWISSATLDRVFLLK